jgi:hypothetical protein
MTVQVKQRMQDPVITALVVGNVRERLARSEKIEQSEKTYLLRLIELRDLVFTGKTTLQEVSEQVRQEHLHLFETMFDCIQLFGKTEQRKNIEFDF